ncbi:hypothetical protein GW17_00016427 [Ensete ventricosum]|nr:hypothetical protein GW17_00016427 [Ensete ventricosum]
MKLQPDDGPRYNLGIRLSSDDVVGSHRKFAKRFIEGIRKLTGNAKGDRREEDQRTYHKIVGGCRSMRDSGQRKSQAGIRKVEGTTFVKISTGKPPVSGGWATVPQNPGDGQQVSAGKSPVSDGWTVRTIDYGRRLMADDG